MSYIKYLLLVITAAVLFSCDDEIDYPYQGKDCIYFEYEYELWKNHFVEYDSVTYSFGKLDNSIRIDTAKVVLRYLGKQSDQVRKYKVKVLDEGIDIDDKTTAEEGVHYQKIEEMQDFSPNELTDTLRIVLLRDNLNPSFTAQESKKLILRLEASEDFELGINKGLEMKVVFNDYLSMPPWWDYHDYYLNFYHPEKWKILMTFDDIFDDVTSTSLDMYAGDLYKYANALNQYLIDNEVRDSETGARVYMDRLEN
ncbi:DUF4843 domain-containing protein [Carboxylicivirga taeanensis]|uniref:DUF4843 domain-containing protein n=1 Tax=Carboxylicivirga taeanensis TaxID=1416875 RepID=UPI003F6DE214